VLSHPLPNFTYIVAKARRARFSASEPHEAGMYKSPDSACLSDLHISGGHAQQP
jgi:hypothetical protein